jgi:hypothetical protein
MPLRHNLPAGRQGDTKLNLIKAKTFYDKPDVVRTLTFRYKGVFYQMLTVSINGRFIAT